MPVCNLNTLNFTKRLTKMKKMQLVLLEFHAEI